jgi:two-component system response regulator MprA
MELSASLVGSAHWRLQRDQIQPMIGRVQMLTGKKILIIEDDVIIGGVYHRFLSQAGCIAEVVADGQTGLDRVADFRPDALLLDLMLPHVNGLTILKSLRASEKFKDLPIIVMTNAYVPSMVNDSMAAGATRVFNKSNFTPVFLLRELRAVFVAAKGADETAA